MKDLTDKIIIVTGANGLIGREIVKELLDRDAIVVAADIVYKAAESLGRGVRLPLDLSSNSSIDELIENTVERYGRIDGLINASYPRTKDWGRYYFEETPFEHWQKNVELQLNSVFYINQKVALVMERQKSVACGRDSMSFRTEEPVVVKPDMVSKKASMKEGMLWLKIKGRHPNNEKISQMKVTVK